MNTEPLLIWIGLFAPLWRDEEAVTTVEYALLLGILVAGSVVAFGQLSVDVSGVAREGSNALEQSVGMGCY